MTKRIFSNADADYHMSARGWLGYSMYRTAGRTMRGEWTLIRTVTPRSGE